MKHFKCSLRMCFPHKVWVKEWQTYHNKTHDNIKHTSMTTIPVTVALCVKHLALMPWS